MKILIVDDEKNILESISRALLRMGHQVIAADSFAKAENLIDATVDAALLDVWLNDGDGVELLKKIKGVHPDIIAVMISGHSSIATAVEAIKHGAYDFLEKPLSLDKLEILLQNIDEVLTLRRQRDDLLARLDDENKLVGDSPAMKELLERINKFAPEEAPVLITGESGSGKELVARLIHGNSPRKKRPFVAINCAALPDELAEAELFGYEKGAFTGALKAHEGHFRRASGGVLFLDEISEMSLRLQAKLLRVIEDKKVMPLAGKSSYDVDVRVLAASNRNLKDEVDRGRFRQDLYFRLNVLPLNVPPLRERVVDIKPLVEYFCNRYAVKSNKKPRHVANSAIAYLEKLNYPGNIRELKNYIERILIISDSDPVEAMDVRSVLSPLAEADSPGASSLKQAVDDFEREYIQKAIRGANDNMAKAARILGIERSHLYKKMKSLGIERADN
jgi:two-component system nitrogen regulation response regulator NtrX